MTFFNISSLIVLVALIGQVLTVEQFQVTGVLKCGADFYEGAHVKLVDNDSWDSDDDIGAAVLRLQR